MNKKMFIISIDSSIVNVALEGNSTFLYEKLITKNGISLEVVEINPHSAKCIVYGNTALLYPNMIVNKTNNYLTIQFDKSKPGKVVDPNMNIISDGIFNVDNQYNTCDSEIEKNNKKLVKKSKQNIENINDINEESVEISLSPEAYNISQIGSNDKIMYTGIKVIDFCTPITFGCKIGVQGGAGVGKAQPLNSKLYTQDGYILMKDVQIGQYIMGNNQLVKVQGIYPQGIKKIFRLELEDKRYMECCEDHICHIVYQENLNEILNIKLKDIDITRAYIPLYPVNFNNKSFINDYEIVLYGFLINSLLVIENSNILISKNVHIDLLKIIEQNLEVVDENEQYLRINNIDINKISNINIDQIDHLSLYLRQLFISSLFNFSYSLFNTLNTRNYVIDIVDFELDIDKFINIVRSTGNISVASSTQLEIIIGKKFIKILSCQYIRDDLAQCISVDDPSGLYFTDDFIITHNTVLTQAILSNVQKINDLGDNSKLFRIFCGIGERLREGRDMYCEFVNSGIIDINKPEDSNSILVYGNMDQPAPIRQLSARVGIAISRYMIDKKNMNVLLIIDNIFRYNQAMSEISAALDQFQTEKGYHPNIYTKMSELQENIAILNNNRSITSIQAIYVPADDADDIGSKTCVKQQSVNIFLSRDYAKRKMFPAIDPLKSVSIYVKKEIVGLRHVQVYNEYIKILHKNRELQDMINMIGVENLSDSDQLIVKRANLLEAYMTQPLSTSKQFINLESQLIDIKDVIEDVANIINGVYDDISVDKLKYQGTIKHLKK